MSLVSRVTKLEVNSRQGAVRERVTIFSPSSSTVSQLPVSILRVRYIDQAFYGQSKSSHLFLKILKTSLSPSSAEVSRSIYALLLLSGVFFKMNVSKTMKTEEDLTCLHIKLYHPQQNLKGLYGLLPLGNKSEHPAEDPLRLGRDTQACTFALVDGRVSRKQLALQAYRTPQSSDMLFCIQNLSQRGHLSVNSSALGYLERLDLPDKALIRFDKYEMLIIRESGEAKYNFAVEFEVLAVPPSRETCTCGPSMTPVMDTHDSYVMNSIPGELRVIGPLENDETIMCHS